MRRRYLIGGQGRPVVLLHGYAETGHMWCPIMPWLAQRHTVIVPDLRGAGGSAKPAAGYDEKTMAVDIHELTSSLKLDRVSIVGHDIGLMVGYPYAAQFREATERVVAQRQLDLSSVSPQEGMLPGYAASPRTILTREACLRA